MLLLESTTATATAAGTLEIADILAQAERDGGNVLIGIAIGRTQELIYHLGEFYHAGKLPQTKVFLDSPMAIAATEVHQRHMQVFSREARTAIRKNGGNAKEFLPPLHFVRTVEESMSLNRITAGACHRRQRHAAAGASAIT
jgi:metallo-beta-lactamase family protein